MENLLSQGVATTSDELSENAFVYKLFSNPTLLETLKRIENVEIFKTLETFCRAEVKVCIFYY